jgi:hypothetical protein
LLKITKVFKQTSILPNPEVKIRMNATKETKPTEVDHFSAGEAGKAYEIFRRYADSACDAPSGWSRVNRVRQDYFTTHDDGSGVTPDPHDMGGLEAGLQITSPSGRLYQASMELNEEAHDERAAEEAEDDWDL